MPLGFILVITVNSKCLKLVTYCLKTLNEIFSQKQILFKTQNFNLIWISYHTILKETKLFFNVAISIGKNSLAYLIILLIAVVKKSFIVLGAD